MIHRKRFPLGAIMCALAFSGPVMVSGQTPSQPDPGPRIVRRPADVLERSLTNRVEPKYPPLAQQAHVTGEVQLEVVVDDLGKVMFARVLSGHPLLKDAALAAVREWTFAPTLFQGVPVKVLSTLSVSFHLDGNPADDAVSDSSVQRGHRESTINEAKEAVKKEPDSVEAKLELAERYADAQKYEDAIGTLNEALRLKPDDREVLESLASIYQDLGRYDDEMLIYKKMLATSPNPLADMERLASKLAQRKRFEEAAEMERRVVEMKPEDPISRLNLGWYLTGAGKYEAAVNEYKRALSLRTNYGLAYHNLGAALYRLRRYEEALDAYEQALRVTPPYDKSAAVFSSLGSTLLMLGRPADAMDAANRVLELEPGMATAYAILGRAYHDLGRFLEFFKRLSSDVAVVRELLDLEHAPVGRRTRSGARPAGS